MSSDGGRDTPPGMAQVAGTGCYSAKQYAAVLTGKGF
jgi:hypothetical protein